MIEVENLSKRYGDVSAIRDISFQARPGQVTGFLGPNGAGKTTTMRILTGFMPPTSGRAIVAGYDVFTDSMEVRRRVGYLPENVPLYRDMSALGYLKFIAAVRGLRDGERRAREVLGRVDLLGRADSRIRTLSKGMRQRVGVAQALIHDPEVLILDEPTIGLDPFQVLELRDLVRVLGRDHTVLFSTHILSEAEQICDKVIIIDRGEIMAEGSPQALRSELESGRPVIVRADAPLDEALALVSALPEVAQASISADGITATPADPTQDPRPAIARAIMERGWALNELRSVAVTLEDIFLEVAGSQAPAMDVAEEQMEVAADAAPEEDEVSHA